MKTWQIITLATAILYIMTTKKALAKVKDNQQFRKCDPFGCGHFGATRGNRKHNGVDVLFAEGEAVKSPIRGVVTRYAYPYASDPSYKGIEIQNEKYTVKMFYLISTVAVGTKINASDIIGKAQNIAQKYGKGMNNHVHLEVRDNKGNLLNPEKLF